MSRVLKYKVNKEITSRNVLLIGPDGEKFGNVPIFEARQKASELGLDLVEVANNNGIAVCKIIDYKKTEYEAKKKQKLMKKKSNVIVTKEIRMRPVIDIGDYNIRINRSKTFLLAGNKVAISIFVRGREMDNIARINKLISQIKEDLKECSQIESEPKAEGRRFNMLFAPLSN